MSEQIQLVLFMLREMLILAVFDFPRTSDPAFVPELTVQRVVGSADHLMP